MRRGVKRSAPFFREEGEKEEEMQRVKIKIIEEPEEVKDEGLEEEEQKIPPPSKNSFLLKAIERKEKSNTVNTQEKKNDQINSQIMNHDPRGNLEKRAKSWLKSLGWQEGEAVGKNGRDRPVSPVLMLQSRPQFLGLGAKPPTHTDDDGSVSFLDNNEERVKIEKGPHKGLFGIIVRPIDNGSITTENKIKLDLSGVIVNINDQPASGLEKIVLGLNVHITSKNANYYKTGQIMDILPDSIVIVKCQYHLLQLSHSDLVCVHPSSVGQKVYIISKDRTGTVQYLEPPTCTVQEDEDKNFLSVLISDCCCIYL